MSNASNIDLLAWYGYLDHAIHLLSEPQKVGGTFQMTAHPPSGDGGYRKASKTVKGGWHLSNDSSSTIWRWRLPQSEQNRKRRAKGGWHLSNDCYLEMVATAKRAKPRETRERWVAPFK
jgi:hypothetical protein